MGPSHVDQEQGLTLTETVNSIEAIRSEERFRSLLLEHTNSQVARRYATRRKRRRDEDSDESEGEDGWDARYRERYAEIQLRAMSFEAREHCARFPHWGLLNWQERLLYARSPSSLVLPDEEIARRREAQELRILMKSVNKLTMTSDYVLDL